jgi:hypothetical protein
VEEHDNIHPFLLEYKHQNLVMTDRRRKGTDIAILASFFLFSATGT